MPKTTISEAIQNLKTAKGLDVVKSGIVWKCGGSNADYIVRDAADGQELGIIPVPLAGDDGRFVTVRAIQLIGASKEEAKARIERLEQARKDFVEDADALEAEFGVSMYDPNALPLNERFPDGGMKQRIYATTEYCFKDGGYISSRELSYDIKLNTSEYVAGRSDYSEDKIYRKGDAKKALLDDPALLGKLKERAAENAAQCNTGRKTTDTPWKFISYRLQKESVESLKRPAYQRFRDDFNESSGRRPLVAGLRNKNTIYVVMQATVNGVIGTYPEAFSGTPGDVLKIERDLALRGIKTDRDQILDYAGTYQKENGLLPAPLPLMP
jgi:hypothetical protein